ncbi:hypothetical protein K523DRAFT_322864 [Schizophyllum commune Tattone D]|nr:hypothetical protein K523DRAFT_322864 [Schizophyllum commune Tattone D]
MPSYGLLHPPAPADAPADHRAPPAQVKTCTSCNCALGGDPSSILAAAPGVDAPVCGRCREHARDTRTQQTQLPQPQDCRQLHHVVPDSPVFPPAQAVAIVQPKAEYEQDIYDATSSPDCDRQPFRVGFPASGSLAQDDRHDGAQAPRHHQKFAQLRIKPPTPSPTHASLSPESSFASPRSPVGAPALSEPLVDITYLRVRPQAHHCLYPGATFTGTQKSGRNSYDVNVTIMDVDFDASFLCGYLSIRGLTDDWPELTTYFDAEIVGSRHGFLTRKWNASEQDDMMHWQRFPAFKAVKHELQKPSYTLPDRDRGAIFMRWKERFLVPDHRVQDINGASFAGFYYVCVDFNSSTHRSAGHMPDMPEDVMEEDVDPSLLPSGKPEPPPMSPSSPRRRRESMGVGVRRRSSSRRPPSLAGTGTATMNGFYYHQNSEPYQQLSLSHVPQVGSSSFEFC